MVAQSGSRAEFSQSQLKFSSHCEMGWMSLASHVCQSLHPEGHLDQQDTFYPIIRQAVVKKDGSSVCNESHQ